MLFNCLWEELAGGCRDPNGWTTMSGDAMVCRVDGRVYGPGGRLGPEDAKVQQYVDDSMREPLQFGNRWTGTLWSANTWTTGSEGRLGLTTDERFGPTMDTTMNATPSYVGRKGPGSAVPHDVNIASVSTVTYHATLARLCEVLGLDSLELVQS